MLSGEVIDPTEVTPNVTETKAEPENKAVPENKAEEAKPSGPTQRYFVTLELDNLYELCTEAGVAKARRPAINVSAPAFNFNYFPFAESNPNLI